MIALKLIGATGYGGLGLIELLLRHPGIRLVACAATQDTGKPVSAVWPYLEGWCDVPILATEDPAFADTDADVTVFATPDGVGQRLAPAELAAGRKVVDYSGDFRFNEPSLYAEYANRLAKDPVHKAPHLLPSAVYGLPELHRDAIRQAKLVGNPGCFAAACVLGFAPAVRNGFVETGNLVADCKSGVSGAGKKPVPAHHFPERQDNVSAYRLSGHQHVMEIERELSAVAGREVRVTFTPQVAPASRGILASLYGRLRDGAKQADVLAAYQAAYRNEPFVKVKGPEFAAGTSAVRGSNRCVVSVACDDRTGTFRVLSYIDNLMKGQAGSAVQNLNVMFGLPETAGLDLPGPHP